MAPIGTQRKDVPPALSEVVGCALARDPAERFASAREMLRALAATLRTQPEPTDAVPLGASVRRAMEAPKRS